MTLPLEGAEPAEKDYRLSDGDGLYLVVQANGGKPWRWSYEFNGKEKLFSYGPWPSVTLANARKLHSEAQALKRTGVFRGLHRSPSAIHRRDPDRHRLSKIDHM